jgi:hypothetical protein
MESSDATTLALVGCGSAKRDEAAPAKDLYTSTYFARKWAVAETYDRQRVYSAKHGLVQPMLTLEPYDATLRADDDAYIGDDAVDRLAADVAAGVRRALAGDVDDVVVLAGRDYADPLRDALDDDDTLDAVRFPFEGLGGLPGQMRWLSDTLDRRVEP